MSGEPKTARIEPLAPGAYLPVPSISHRRKGAAEIVIEGHDGDGLILALSGGRVVARARRDGAAPQYAVRLANGRYVGSARDVVGARLMLPWAGRYFLGLEARGIA